MKNFYKFLLSAMACAAAVPAMADGFTQSAILGGWNEMVAFPKEGQGYISIITEEGNDDGVAKAAKIYDKNLQEVTEVRAQNGSLRDFAIWASWSQQPMVYDGEDVYFTQTLFNDDDAFEYFEVDAEDNLYLMQSTGNCLGTILVNDVAAAVGQTTVEVDFDYIYILDDMIYFRVDAWNYDEWSNFGEWYVWYRWDGQNGLNQVAVQKAAVKAYPNPVTRGEIFNIVVDSEVGGECSVVVYNMRGGVATVAKGESSSLSIDTSSLAQGNYVYRVNANGKEVSQGKLIVR